MLGVLGLFMSALFGRTGRATVASFISVVLLMIAPMFVAVLVGVLKSAEPPRWILAPSPISALSGALAPSMGTSSGFDVFYALSGIWNMGVNPISQSEIPRPLYHYSLPLFMGMTLVMFLLTTRLVQPSRRWRMRRKEVLGGLLALLVFAAVVGAAFLSTANHYEWALRDQSLQLTFTPVVDFPMQAVPAGIVEQKVVPAYPVENGPLKDTPAPTATAAYPGPAAQTPPAPANLDVETQKAIYSAVIHQMYQVDHTFEKAPNFPVIYIVQQTDDSIGDPNVPHGESMEFTEELRSQITASLADLPAEIIWAAAFEDVPKDPTSGEVRGKGVIFRLGNIHSQEDGSVQVSASLYFASLGAAGKTYILAFQNGVWTITGTTGVEWIS
jgi:hypothetical protein